MNSYFPPACSFNMTAARVWDLLAEARTFETLCAQLTAEFEVENEQCRIELRRLLDEFETAGLLEPDIS